jgi:hypothetical protein
VGNDDEYCPSVIPIVRLERLRADRQNPTHNEAVETPQKKVIHMRSGKLPENLGYQMCFLLFPNLDYLSLSGQLMHCMSVNFHRLVKIGEHRTLVGLVLGKSFIHG